MTHEGHKMKNEGNDGDSIADFYARVVGLVHDDDVTPPHIKCEHIRVKKEEEEEEEMTNDEEVGQVSSNSLINFHLSSYSECLDLLNEAQIALELRCMRASRLNEERKILREREKRKARECRKGTSSSSPSHLSLPSASASCSLSSLSPSSSSSSSLQSPSPSPSSSSSSPSPLPSLSSSVPQSSSFGMRMLQQLGWREGEGLGKDATGRTEPILPKQRKDRIGLGAENAHIPSSMLAASRFSLSTQPTTETVDDDTVLLGLTDGHNHSHSFTHSEKETLKALKEQSKAAHKQRKRARIRVEKKAMTQQHPEFTSENFFGLLDDIEAASDRARLSDQRKRRRVEQSLSSLSSLSANNCASLSERQRERIERERNRVQPSLYVSKRVLVEDLKLERLRDDIIRKEVFR